MLGPDMSEVVSDPDFQTSFTRLRPTTVFVQGTEGETSTTYAESAQLGIVQPTGRPDQMDPQPEGERMDSWIMIMSAEPVLMAEPDTVSDIVKWEGSTYRVMKVENYGAYGYHVAYAQEYHGDTPTQPDPVEEGP